jgi:cysteine desulfurase
MIYLDNNATTIITPAVCKAVHSAMDCTPSNPSSPHNAGHFAREILFKARLEISKLVNCFPEQIYFTSGGTEGNNLILDSIFNFPFKTLLTSNIEHSSIASKCKSLDKSGVSIIEIGVNKRGIVDIKQLETILEKEKVDIVSIHWVNGETGVIQPIQLISEICDKYDVFFHSDAVQALGKLPIDLLKNEKIKALTFSGHKLHAPMGVGAVYIKNINQVKPLLYGGTQESSIRPGSQNIIGICGFKEAVFQRRRNFKSCIEKIKTLRDFFESELIGTFGNKISIHSKNDDRVCNTSNVCFHGVDGEILLVHFFDHGLCCSQGSACTSSIPEPSRVLLNMGVSRNDAFSSIRFSFAKNNTKQEIVKALKIIINVINKFSNF